MHALSHWQASLSKLDFSALGSWLYSISFIGLIVPLIVTAVISSFCIHGWTIPFSSQPRCPREISPESPHEFELWDSLLKLANQLFDSESDPAGSEQLRALWTMVWNLEGLKLPRDSIKRHRLRKSEASSPSLRGLQSIFEHMGTIPDPETSLAYECFTELARLVLFYLCIKHGSDLQKGSQLRSWGKSLPRMDSLGSEPLEAIDFAEFLFQRFPKAPDIEYRHLAFPSGLLDCSTALVDAAKFLDYRFLAILLSHGADINANVNGRTPLSSVISAGKKQSFEFLLERGATINAYALIAACDMDDLKILDVILKIPHVDFNAIAEIGGCATALIRACKSGRVETVRKLLHNENVSVNRTVENRLYTNALSAAVDAKALRVVRLLLRHGAHKLSMADPGSEIEIAIEEDPRRMTVDGRCKEWAKWLVLLCVRGDKEQTNRANTASSHQLVHNKIQTQFTNMLNLLKQDLCQGAVSRSVCFKLARACGFESAGIKNELAVGLAELLKSTAWMANRDDQDLQLIIKKWSDFLDSAEDCEHEFKPPGIPSGPNIELLMLGGTTVKRSDILPVEDDFMAVYTDDEDESDDET